MIVDIDAGNTRIKWQASLGDRRLDAGAEQLSEEPLLSVHAALSSCLLYTSPSPRDKRQSRMPSSA